MKPGDTVVETTAHSTITWTLLSGPPAYSWVMPFRQSTKTATLTANQVLFTIPLETDHTVNEIHLLVVGKRTGNGGDGCTCDISGSFTREGSTITRLGIDGISTPRAAGGLAGTTFDLSINGNAVEVRVSPGGAVTMLWTVAGENVKVVLA